MDNENNTVNDTEVVSVVAPTEPPPAPPTPTPPFPPPPPEKISDKDQEVLEKANFNKTLTLALAEKAIAENKLADLQYKYNVLQIYVKYGLTSADALDEHGNVYRGVK